LISHRAVDYVNRMAGGGAPFSSACTTPRRTGPGKRATTRRWRREVKDNLFHLHGGNIHSYRRMIHHMDEGIGWVLDALRAKGIADNTLVVFTSDNGGERFSDSWPLWAARWT
jgi:arylsulfatase A-like enzyme